MLGLTDETGQLREGYQYDPFGRPVVYKPGASGVVTFTTADTIAVGGTSAVNNPYQFQGQRRDAATGLDYFKARYYSESLGRFISRDPAGFAAGDINLYRAEGNSPANATDPLGLWNFWNPLTWGMNNAPDEGWRDKFNPFGSSAGWQQFGQAAGEGVVEGAYNEGQGIIKSVREVGNVARDVPNIAEAVVTGHTVPIRSQLFGGMIQANQQGQAVQYFGNTVANMGTLGYYGQGQALFHGFQTGDFQEFQEAAGANLFWTAVPAAAGMAWESFGPNSGNIPRHREGILRDRARRDAVRDIQQEAIRNNEPIPGMHEPGPNAVEGVQIRRGQSYRSDEIRFQNDVNGNRYGCHICGGRQPGTSNGHWIRDRIPSEQIAGSDVKVQRIYPSCQQCSNFQGFLVAYRRWLRDFLGTFGR